VSVAELPAAGAEARDDRPTFFKTLLLAAGMMTVGVAIGSRTGEMARDPLATPPIPYSAEELNRDELVQATWPITITLRIVDQETFDREDFYRRSQAFSNISVVPCQVVVPAGALIRAHPAQSEAHWVASLARPGDTLAHKILHCLRGNWHRYAGGER
jgi:hypothetical protein